MEHIEKMLSCKDVAKQYGITVPTVRSWIKNGILPAKKIGKKLFVVPSDLALLGNSDGEAIAKGDVDQCLR